MNLPLDRARQQFANKKVLIFGLGLLGGGIGDVRFFHQVGAKVTVTDQKTETELTSALEALKNLPITFHLGEHLQSDIEDTDFIIKNPSVPDNHPLLEIARNLNKPVLMRSSLFASLSEATIVGITGTRGKTTTTMMIHHLLSSLLTDKKVLLGGNILGVSDLELLSKIDDPQQTIVVLELSSWQLQGFKHANLSPHIAVVTNLFPDHLNRYQTLADYYQDKQAIIVNQQPEDVAILNQDQPECKQWAETAVSQIKWFSKNDLPETLHLKIPGEHNRANAAAAIKVAEAFDVHPDQVVDVLNQFEGVPYRLETVSIHQGVSYINDTTATTPEAVNVALKSMKVPPIHIVGGSDKGLPLELLADSINHYSKKVILLKGSGTDKLKPLLNQDKIVGEFSNLTDAFNQAVSLAESGDIVLLSPGFASFGMFVNEFDRGEQFNQCTHHLD